MEKDIAELIAINVCKSKKYNFVEYKGSGAFKHVFHITKNNNNYALKIIGDNIDILRTRREINAILKCNHSNIANLYYFDEYVYNHNNYYYIIEDYIAGNTLTDYIINNGKLSINEIKVVGVILFDILSHLYDNNMVHRDIKPDNIMLRNTDDISSIVLIDFGLVRDLSETSITETWLHRGPGTACYSAPEQLNNDKKLIDWRTDQFSVGVTLSMIRYFQHPFQNNGEKQCDHIIIDRVCNYKLKSKDFLENIKLDNLQPIDKMTNVWPINRYLYPSELKKLW